MFIAGANFIRLCSGEDQRERGARAGRRGRSVVLGEKRAQHGRHFHLTRCHISAAARACLHPSPSALRLSRRDTNYRFLALPAYCLIIYASFADIATFVVWNFFSSTTQAVTHGASRCRVWVQYTLLGALRKKLQCNFIDINCIGNVFADCQAGNVLWLYLGSST